MNLYATEIKAIVNGDVSLFAGPHVPGISIADAQEYCERNKLGYCTVVGRLIAETNAIPGMTIEEWVSTVVDPAMN
jgi:hypothetical protein